MIESLKPRHLLLATAALALAWTAGLSDQTLADQPTWRVGLAAAQITPEEPIRMCGYAGRTDPSQGVVADLYAKAMAIEDAEGHRALLITADLIGFSAELAETVCRWIHDATGLERSQILLNPSHTHTGPVVGIIPARRSPFTENQRKAISRYTKKLQDQLVRLAADAVAELSPARLRFGTGTAEFVMNRRERTDRGVRLGVNPEGYRDTNVPVLRVDSPEGKLRAVVFGCACHNTTCTGRELRISGDYAGFAQADVQQRHPGVQAMFVLGCGGDANPHPRGSVEIAKQHGRSLGAEVCRVLEGELTEIAGPLRTELAWPELPLQPVPAREELEKMAEGPRYLAFNAKRMLETLDAGGKPPSRYKAPVALWQFGDDLTLVALPGETLSAYVPLTQDALGPQRLWVAGYSNDVFGYLPSAKVLEEGGYETRGLFDAIGYFAPEAEKMVIDTVTRLARAAGRKTAR